MGSRKRKSNKVSPYYLPNELYEFDIVLLFKKGVAPSIHYNEEMQKVFDTLASEHDVFLLKLNWSDPHLHLIIPPVELAHLFTSPQQQEATNTEE